MNNPIRFNDPTGHMVADDEDGGVAVTGYINFIEKKYKWKLKGKFGLDEVKTIYQTGRDIETYVDGLTDGKGQEWMNTYLGGTTIEHWSGENHRSMPWWSPTNFGENTISLASSNVDSHWLAHEFGHIWDINTGGICTCGAVGGVGDMLNAFVGGLISGSTDNRYENYAGKPADLHIPPFMSVGDTPVDVRFSSRVANGYGNGSTADYLAESFSWNVVDPQKVPLFAGLWVDNTIIAQAQSLP